MARVEITASASQQSPLCCKYALVLVSPFTVEIATWSATKKQRWRWAFGMHAHGECEALGGWPASTSHDLLLREHLRERGVECIGALLGDENLARVMGIPLAMRPLNKSGVAATAKAAQLHAKIERAVSRASPFANLDSVSACVGQVFGEADRAELARQRRSLREQWRARVLQAPAPAARA